VYPLGSDDCPNAAYGEFLSRWRLATGRFKKVTVHCKELKVLLGTAGKQVTAIEEFSECFPLLKNFQTFTERVHRLSSM
jgi:hypothetical protein